MSDDLSRGAASTEASADKPANDAKPTALVFAAALAFYAVFIFRTSFVAVGQRWFVLFEDAMISMRYARNFADGNGLVWNAGEAPVEGYTNLLWTLWMAAVHKLGLPPSKISLVLMLTGVVILMLNALVVRALAREVSNAKWAPLAATTATLFFYPLIFWTLRGMEVGALTLFIDTLLLLAIRLENKWTFQGALAMALLAAAAFLLRSDSAVSCGLISGYAVLVTVGAGRFITAGAIGGFFAAAMVAQLLFRKATYHEPLPNTYYLKLLHVPLSARLKRGVFVALQVIAFHLAVPLAALFGAIAGTRSSSPSELMADVKRWIRTKEDRRLLLLGAIVSIQVAYAVYVGGDAWEWMLYANRYTTVAAPALVLLTVAMLGRLFDEDSETSRARAAKTAETVLILAGALLLALYGFAKVAGETTGIARTIVPSKSTAAGGVLLLLIGVALVGPFADRVRSAIASAADKLSQPQTMATATFALFAVVFLPAQLQGFGSWAVRNAAQFNDEGKYTRLGLLIAYATPPHLRIAVVAAGATPYFSERPSEDLLGKNDAFIAKLHPQGVFSPGHDKWDYKYSLGERKPDLIVELADVSPADQLYVDSLGFRALPNGMLLRDGAAQVNRETLGRIVDTPAELDEALATSVDGMAARAPAAKDATSTTSPMPAAPAVPGAAK